MAGQILLLIVIGKVELDDLPHQREDQNLKGFSMVNLPICC